MQDKEILRQCITKAQNNGWEYDVSDEQLCITRYLNIIFDHSFCKAFWGEEEKGEWISNGDGTETLEGSNAGWQYHIQQLALSEDRLKYLSQFLKTESPK